MTDNKNATCFIKKVKLSTDEAKTVVAKVNPRTGELLIDENHGINSKDPMETEIIVLPKVDARKKTAEFIPKVGMHATGGRTVFWNENNRINIKELGQIIICFIVKRRKTAVLLALSAIALLGTIVFASGGKQKSGKNTNDYIDLSSSADEIKDSVNKTEVIEIPKIVKNIPPDEYKNVTVKMAVDALLGGNLVRAMNMYKSLAKNNPDETSFRLAVEILRLRVEK